MTEPVAPEVTVIDDALGAGEEIVGVTISPTVKFLLAFVVGGVLGLVVGWTVLSLVRPPAVEDWPDDASGYLDYERQDAANEAAYEDPTPANVASDETSPDAEETE